MPGPRVFLPRDLATHIANYPATKRTTHPTHGNPACVGQSIFLHKVYANIFTRNPHKLRMPSRCPNKPYLLDVWGSVSGPAAPAPAPAHGSNGFNGSTGSGPAYFACHLRLSTLRRRFWPRSGGALRVQNGSKRFCVLLFDVRQINL